MRSAFLLIESVRLIYLMISVNSAPALNLTDLRAGISIGCLVFGLTPLRADFSATEKEPKPKRATLPPSFNSLDTVSPVHVEAPDWKQTISDYFDIGPKKTWANRDATVEYMTSRNGF